MATFPPIGTTEDIVTPGPLNRLFRVRLERGWLYILEPAGGAFWGNYEPDAAEVETAQLCEFVPGPVTLSDESIAKLATALRGVPSAVVADLSISIEQLLAEQAALAAAIPVVAPNAPSDATAPEAASAADPALAANPASGVGAATAPENPAAPSTESPVPPAEQPPSAPDSPAAA